VKNISNRTWLLVALFGFLVAGTRVDSVFAEALPNACPVDGCEVRIVGVKRSGDELELTIEANFSPDISKNHIHVWWGENYTVQQVSADAQAVHGVTQGKWHPTGDYPVYVTQRSASMSMRGDAENICVSAADRKHYIIDINVFNCTDVRGQF
jgi:hypothetical protein